LRAVKRCDFLGNPLFQRLKAGHRRILVLPGFHGAGDTGDQFRVTGKIRCALRKVDGVMLCDSWPITVKIVVPTSGSLDRVCTGVLKVIIFPFS
jgi:hypothetical protein